MNTSELANKVRGAARNLTYNGKSSEAVAKHLLLECAHILDTQSIKARRRGMRLILTNALGASRGATIREALAYMIAGTLPRSL